MFKGVSKMSQRTKSLVKVQEYKVVEFLQRDYDGENDGGEGIYSPTKRDSTVLNSPRGTA